MPRAGFGVFSAICDDALPIRDDRLRVTAALEQAAPVKPRMVHGHGSEFVDRDLAAVISSLIEAYIDAVQKPHAMLGVRLHLQRSDIVLRRCQQIRRHDAQDATGNQDPRCFPQEMLSAPAIELRKHMQGVFDFKHAIGTGPMTSQIEPACRLRRTGHDAQTQWTEEKLARPHEALQRSIGIQPAVGSLSATSDLRVGGSVQVGMKLDSLQLAGGSTPAALGQRIQPWCRCIEPYDWNAGSDEAH